MDDEVVLILGGWSKVSYLTEVECFYPKKQKLVKQWNGLRLEQSDMVTKRPVLHKGHIFILGRLHSHCIILQNMKVKLFRD